MTARASIESVEAALRRNPQVIARLLARAEARGVRFRDALALLLIESNALGDAGPLLRRVYDDIWMELAHDLRREAERRVVARVPPQSQ